MFGSFFNRRPGAKPIAPTYQCAEIYTAMRSKILSLSAEKIDDAGENKAKAILIEIGRPEAVVTLVSYGDGGASMYFSSGGGIIGAGEVPHQDARAASLCLIAAAPTFLSQLSKTSDFPLPHPGFGRFYLVMPTGVYTSEVKLEDLYKKQNSLWQLFYLGDQLITQIRLIDQAVSKPAQS